MRGQQAFRIDGYDKQIIVYELTIKQIISLFSLQDLSEEISWSELVLHVQENLLPIVTNLSANEILDFTPSEMEILWKKVKEVNKAFFGLIRTPTLKAVFEELKPRILGAFGNSFAVLSKLDMSMQKIMDTPSS